MTAKITRDVLEGYLNCKYKGHLKQTGEAGTRSEYEAMLLAARAEVRLKAIDKVLACHSGDEVARNVLLTVATLKRGPLFVLDVTLEDDLVSLRFDGLKRVEGPSKLGNFHYVPMLFHEGEKVRKEQRLLLEVYALLLSRLQGRTPGTAIVWHGKGCKPTKIRLGPNPRRAERVLRDLEGAQSPRLVLNDHCQVCEFRQRCHEQAVKEDNLSLLRGIGEKEIRSYARRGILTLTQLAHTFRPRRKGKRAVKTHHRYHALQALAIRDKRFYVFGTPEVPDSPVKIYLDLEGVPDEGFVYLIGMLVVREATEERFSFWADTKEHEQEMFEQFLAQLTRYEDVRVFCYGSYERAFLKRMRKTAKRKKPVDCVLGRLVNVLSLVYAHVYFSTYTNGLEDVAGSLGCSWTTTAVTTLAANLPLKDVAGSLGCSWTEPDASGLQSLVWRARWEATRSDEWKQKLLTYNLEDCAALRKVAELVSGVGSPAAPAGVGNCPPVARVQELDRWANDPKWGPVNFVHPDYAYINDCAYFDYQRERVFVRGNRALKRRLARTWKHRNRRLRVSQRVEVTAARCPACGGTDITRQPKKNRVKRAFDLVITPAGIRRRVIECRAPSTTAGGASTPSCPRPTSGWTSTSTA
jgi:predicted RecB family nuclease